MEVTEIHKYLPHRYPFLLVDRVIEFEADKRIVAIKNVTANEPMFAGHFPANPIFPGLYIVEALAQVSGILAFKSRNRTLDDGYVYYLAGTDKTKFKRSVIPGDQLRLEVELLEFKGKRCRMRGEAFVDGKKVTEAEMMAGIVDR